MTCPIEPLPAGWKIWRQAAVPPPLTQWAVDTLKRINTLPYGQIVATTQWAGGSVALFKSHHTWTYRNGALVTGICIPGVSLLTPTPSQTFTATSAVDDLTIPDPTAAVFSAPPDSIDWRLVAISATASAAVVAAFFLALRHAGRAHHPRLR